MRLENNPNYSLIVNYTSGKVMIYELGAIQTNEDGGQHDLKVIDHFVSTLMNIQRFQYPVNRIRSRSRLF